MAIPEAVLRDWELLSEQNKADVCNYIGELLKRQTGERVNPVRKLGTLAYRFRGISDDFDDPLSGFNEYTE